MRWATFSYLLGVVDVLLHLLLFCDGELGRTSTSFMIIQSSKTSRCPGIKTSYKESDALHQKPHEVIACHALETQQNKWARCLTRDVLLDCMIIKDVDVLPSSPSQRQEQVQQYIEQHPKI